MRTVAELFGGTDNTLLAPTSCNNCTRCWLVLTGPKAGECIYGGPYEGFEYEDQS